MFLLACHGTSVAADTSILVDDESIAHRRLYIVSAPGDSLDESPGLTQTNGRTCQSGHVVSDCLLSSYIQFNTAIASATFLTVVPGDRPVLSESLRRYAIRANALADQGSLNRVRARQG